MAKTYKVLSKWYTKDSGYKVDTPQGSVTYKRRRVVDTYEEGNPVRINREYKYGRIKEDNRRKLVAPTVETVGIGGAHTRAKLAADPDSEKDVLVGGAEQELINRYAKYTRS